jgi:hypothetical protein
MVVHQYHGSWMAFVKLREIYLLSFLEALETVGVPHQAEW